MNKTCTHYFGRLFFSLLIHVNAARTTSLTMCIKSCLRTTDIHTHVLAATIHTYGTWFKHKAITRRCCAVNMENVYRTRFRHFVSVSVSVSVSVLVFSFQYKALVYNNICKFKSTQSYKRDAIFDTFFRWTKHSTIFVCKLYILCSIYDA